MSAKRLAAAAVAAFGLLACACSAPAPRAASPERALLERAIAAMGGERALSQARTLAWEGEATVFAGDRRIELGIDTVVVPFRSARSDSWLRERGRSTLRRLEIEGERGWTTRDGQRTPMPAPMLRHERAQYAVYGLMRLLPLREPGVVLRRLPDDARGRRCLHAEHPQAPPADLCFDAAGRLVSLENRVPAAEGDGEVAQRFEFEGDAPGDARVRWPRVLRITQGGAPYFELRIARFRTE